MHEIYTSYAFWYYVHGDQWTINQHVLCSLCELFPSSVTCADKFQNLMHILGIVVKYTEIVIKVTTIYQNDSG